MLTTRHVTTSGVCVVTFDRPESSANILDAAAFDEIDGHLAFVRRSEGVRGLVFRSAKPGIFIAGADLNQLDRARDLAEIGAMIDRGHEVFNAIAALGCPTVAAVHGLCLGGGLELALACDVRVASSADTTKLGLPEILLGFIPGWGGSTRLSRVIGLRPALDAILNGRTFPAEKARRLGLVDEVVPPELLLEVATQRALTDAKRELAPRPDFARRPLARAFVAALARRAVMARTRGCYPAPLAAIGVVVRGASGSTPESQARERKVFLDLVATPQSRQLLRLFFLQERAKKTKPPGGAVARSVSRIGVIGAGVMGAGIAQWSAARGLSVWLNDVAPAALASGMATVGRLFQQGVKRGAVTPAAAQAGRDRVVPVAHPRGFARADLVIEAIAEKLELKRQVFAALEAHIGPETVLASNTSALSLTAIAQGLAHPERVVGIHFFNPVHRMQLVEIVRGEQTGEAAIATALGYVKALGKLPVIVADRPGFLVNRILMPYLAEAVRLFREGHTPERIDAVMLDFGMPMGPLRLNDEVGTDVAEHVGRDLAARLAAAGPLDDTLTQMIAKGWLGKKSGTGFYLHTVGKKSREDARSNPALAALRTGTRAPRRWDERQAMDRLVLAMVNEAARCLEERVVADAADADLAMVMGTGWAPFRGGPLRYADSLGIGEVTTRLEQLAREIGPYFEPAPLLRRMASGGVSFYPEGRA